MENQEESKQGLAKTSQESLPLNTFKLTRESVAIAITKLSKVYPSLTEGFYDVLIERIKYYKFSDWEFDRAVNHIIDTNKYPPLVSDFIIYMRPDGVADIPNREPKPQPIRMEDAPVEERDLSFLDRYADDYDETHKIKKPKGFEDFEPASGK